MSTKAKIKRFTSLLAAAGLAVGSLTPILMNGTAYATGSGGLVSSRSIQMSNATTGSAAQSYDLTFTPVTTEPSTGDGIVIDFCNNSPIIGAICDYDSGTTVPNVSSSATASVGTISVVNSHTIQLTDVTLTAGTAFTVTFSGITNPSTAASFYARVTTYASATTGYTTEAASGDAATLGSYVDWGGIALSTTNTISVSATVMETLTFCVSGSSLVNGACSSATTPSVTLGSGTPPALSTTAVSTGTAYTQLSTNASHGAIINMKASNSCTNGGLSSGNGSTCSIAGIGGTSAAITAGTWGLNVSASTNNTTGGSGSITGTAAYATANQYGMNGTNVTSTYGDTIANTGGAPCALTNNTLTFAAEAATTTPAGVYTGNESLIATGTF